MNFLVDATTQHWCFGKSDQTANKYQSKFCFNFHYKPKRRGTVEAPTVKAIKLCTHHKSQMHNGKYNICTNNSICNQHEGNPIKKCHTFELIQISRIKLKINKHENFKKLYFCFSSGLSSSV